MNTNSYQNFVKTIEPLTRRHERSKVFNDFLTASICGYHQINIQSKLQIKDETNEKLYMETIASYTKEEINTFPKLLGIFIQSVHQAPYGDLLGEYFTEHITKGQNGQFFTPTAVCELMASLQAEPNTVENKSVADPACGSGRLLLAFAKSNPKNFFYGADNANTCAKMATLNFFLNGLRGEVAWMNTLSMEWYGGWKINNNGLGILPIEKEDSRIWSHPPKPNENKDQQLTLF